VSESEKEGEERGESRTIEPAHFPVFLGANYVHQSFSRVPLYRFRCNI